MDLPHRLKIFRSVLTNKQYNFFLFPCFFNLLLPGFKSEIPLSFFLLLKNFLPMVSVESSTLLAALNDMSLTAISEAISNKFPGFHGYIPTQRRNSKGL